MPILLVVILLLLEPVIIAAALFLFNRYKLRPNMPKARQRRDTPGWVYEIIDPDSGVTVYVGQAADVEKRVDQHLRASVSTGMLYRWIADQVQNGKRPIVRVVAHGNNRNEVARLERERIHMHVAAGAKLFNRQVSESASRLARYVIIEELED